MNTVPVVHPAPATTDLIFPMGLGIRAGLNDSLFQGALADCRIYNRRLSVAEVGALFSKGAAVTVQPAVPAAKAPTPPSNLKVHSVSP